jgi:hypothetical protein
MVEKERRQAPKDFHIQSGFQGSGGTSPSRARVEPRPPAPGWNLALPRPGNTLAPNQKSKIENRKSLMAVVCRQTHSFQVKKDGLFWRYRA